LYNIAPDIISRLSDPETGVDEIMFRTIMKYVLGTSPDSWRWSLFVLAKIFYFKIKIVLF